MLKDFLHFSWEVLQKVLGWGGGGGRGGVGWGGDDIMCHVHSHQPSHHIGKTLDKQSLITGKHVLVVHNTMPPALGF